MSAAAVSSTTGYINYVYNVEAKGVSQLSSEIMGASGAINNMLGQLAFQTSAYLSRTESAAMSMGIVATAGLFKATQQAIKFDYAMQSVQAIAGKNNIGDLGNQALEMSNKFGVAVDKMTKGLESLARAGVSPQNMSGILEQAMGLSKLEDLDLNTAINDLLSTTNLLDTQNLDLESPEYVEALKYQNQKITATSEAAPINAQDIIHTLEHVGGYASSTNIDQDDLYAVIAQLGSKGTRSELAGTSLRAFLAAGQKDTAQRALKRIGLTVSDLWKNDDTIMSISDMKDVLDEAMDERGYSKQERLEFYSDFVGYKQANQVMKIDTTSVREYKDKIDQSLDINEKINMVLNTTQTRLQNIFQTGKNFLTKVGQPIMFALDQILKPISLVMNIIDKIPGLGLVLGIGTMLTAMKGIATIFNKLAPMVFNVTNNFKGIRGYIKDAGEELKEMVSILRNHGNKDFVAMKVVKNEIEHIGLDDIKAFLPQLKDLPAHMQNTFAQMFEFNMSDTDRQQLIKMKASMFENGYYDPTELSSYTSDALTKVNQAIYTYNQKNFGDLSAYSNQVSQELKDSIGDTIFNLTQNIRDASDELGDNVRGVTDYQSIGLNVDAIKSAALVNNGSAYEYGLIDFFHELAHNLLEHDKDTEKTQDVKDAEAIAFAYKLADTFGVHYDQNWRRRQENTFNVDNINEDAANNIDNLLRDIRSVPDLQKSIIAGYNRNVEALGLDAAVPRNFAMFGGLTDKEDEFKKLFKIDPTEINEQFHRESDTFAQFLSKARSIPGMLAKIATRIDEWLIEIDGKGISTKLADLEAAITGLSTAINQGMKIEKYVKVDKVVNISERDKKVFEEGFRVKVDLEPITQEAQKELEKSLKVDASDAKEIVAEIQSQLQNVTFNLPKLTEDMAKIISATVDVDVNKEDIKKAVSAAISEKIDVQIQPDAINNAILEKIGEANITIDKSNADAIVSYIVSEILKTELKVDDEGFVKAVLEKLTGVDNADGKQTFVSVGSILQDQRRDTAAMLNILKSGIVNVNIVSGGGIVDNDSGGGSPPTTPPTNNNFMNHIFRYVDERIANQTDSTIDDTDDEVYKDLKDEISSLESELKELRKELKKKEKPKSSSESEDDTTLKFKPRIKSVTSSKKTSTWQEPTEEEKENWSAYKEMEEERHKFKSEVIDNWGDKDFRRKFYAENNMTTNGQNIIYEGGTTNILYDERGHRIIPQSYIDDVNSSQKGPRPYTGPQHGFDAENLRASHNAITKMMVGETKSSKFSKSSTSSSAPEIHEPVKVFFDIETTGIIKDERGRVIDNGEIIQIGAIKEYADGRIEEYKSNVLPFDGRKITDEAIKTHGITNEEIQRTGRDPHQVANEFAAFISDADLLGGHNVNFDAVGMRKFLQETIGYDLNKPMIDTQTMAADLLGVFSNLKGLKNTDLGRRLDNEIPDNVHDALADIQLTFANFKKLQKLADKMNVDLTEYINIISYPYERPTFKVPYFNYVHTNRLVNSPNLGEGSAPAVAKKMSEPARKPDEIIIDGERDGASIRHKSTFSDALLPEDISPFDLQKILDFKTGKVQRLPPLSLGLIDKHPDIINTIMTSTVEELFGSYMSSGWTVLGPNANDAGTKFLWERIAKLFEIMPQYVREHSASLPVGINPNIASTDLSGLLSNRMESLFNYIQSKGLLVSHMKNKKEWEKEYGGLNAEQRYFKYLDKIRASIDVDDEDLENYFRGVSEANDRGSLLDFINSSGILNEEQMGTFRFIHQRHLASNYIGDFGDLSDFLDMYFEFIDDTTFSKEDINKIKDKIEDYKERQSLFSKIKVSDVLNEDELADYMTLEGVLNIKENSRKMEYYRLIKNKPFLKNMALNKVPSNVMAQVVKYARPDLIENGIISPTGIGSFEDYVKDNYNVSSEELSKAQYDKIYDDYQKEYKHSIAYLMNNPQVYNDISQYINDVYESPEWKMVNQVKDIIKNRLVSSGVDASTAESKAKMFIKEHAAGTSVEIGPRDSFFTVIDKIRQSPQHSLGFASSPKTALKRIMEAASIDNQDKMLDTYEHDKKHSHHKVLSPGEIAILESFRPKLDEEGNLIESPLEKASFYRDILSGTIDNPFGDSVYNINTLSDYERFLIASHGQANLGKIYDMSNLKITEDKGLLKDISDKIQEICTIQWKLEIATIIEYLDDTIQYITSNSENYSPDALQSIADIVKGVYVNKAKLAVRWLSKNNLGENVVPTDANDLLNRVLGDRYNTELSAKEQPERSNEDKKRVREEKVESVENFRAGDVGVRTLEEGDDWRHLHKINLDIAKTTEQVKNATMFSFDILGAQDQMKFATRIHTIEGVANAFTRQDPRFVYNHTRDDLDFESHEGEIYDTGEVDENNKPIYDTKPATFNYGNTFAGVDENNPNSSIATFVQEGEELPYWMRSINIANIENKNMQPEVVTLMHIARRLKSRDVMNAMHTYIKLIAELDPLGGEFLTNYSLFGQTIDPYMTPEKLTELKQGPFMRHAILNRFNQQFFPSLPGVYDAFINLGSKDPDKDFALYIKRLQELFHMGDVKELGPTYQKADIVSQFMHDLLGTPLDVDFDSYSNTFATTLKGQGKNDEEKRADLAKQLEREEKLGNIIGKPIVMSSDKTQAKVWNLTKLFNNMDDTAFIENVHMLTIFMNSLKYFNVMLDGVKNEVVNGQWSESDIRDLATLSGIMIRPDIMGNFAPGTLNLTPTNDSVISLKRDLTNIFNTKHLLNDLYGYATGVEIKNADGALDADSYFDPMNSGNGYNIELLAHLANINDDVYEYLKYLDLSYFSENSDLNALAEEIDGDFTLDQLKTVRDQMSRQIKGILYVATILREIDESLELFDDVNMANKGILINSLAGAAVNNNSNEFLIAPSLSKDTIFDPNEVSKIQPNAQSIMWLMNGADGEQYTFQGADADKSFIKKNKTLNDIDTGALKNFHNENIGNLNIVVGAESGQLIALGGMGKLLSYSGGRSDPSDTKGAELVGKSQKKFMTLHKNLEIIKEIHSLLPLLTDMSEQPADYGRTFELQIKEYIGNLIGRLDKSVIDDNLLQLTGGEKFANVIDQLLSYDVHSVVNNSQMPIRKKQELLLNNNFLNNILDNVDDIYSLNIHGDKLEDDFVNFITPESMAEQRRKVSNVALMQNRKDNKDISMEFLSDFSDLGAFPVLNDDDVKEPSEKYFNKRNKRMRRLVTLGLKGQDRMQQRQDMIDSIVEMAVKSMQENSPFNFIWDFDFSILNEKIEEESKKKVKKRKKPKVDSNKVYKKEKEVDEDDKQNDIPSYIANLVKSMEKINKKKGVKSDLIDQLLRDETGQRSNIATLLENDKSMLYNFVHSQAGITIQGLYKDYLSIQEDEIKDITERMQNGTFIPNKGQTSNLATAINKRVKGRRNPNGDKLIELFNSGYSMPEIKDIMFKDISQYSVLKTKREKSDKDERRIKDFEDMYFNGSVNILDLAPAIIKNKKAGRPEDFLSYLFEHIKYGQAKNKKFGTVQAFDYTGASSVKNVKDSDFSSTTRQSPRDRLDDSDISDPYRSKSNKAYTDAKQKLSGISDQGTALIGRSVGSIYKMVTDNIDTEKIDSSLEMFNDLNQTLDKHVNTIRSWNAALYEFADVIPGLSLAVLGLEQILNTVALAQRGASLISGLIAAGADTSMDVKTPTGMIKATIGKALGEVFGTLQEIFMPYIMPILGALAALTVGFFTVKTALDWSFQSHQKYMKTLEEEQKEHKSSSRSLQATVNQTRKLAEKNNNPIKQVQRDRKYELARTRLANANMSRASTAIDMTRAKNDTLWGDYGISAGLSKLSGNYESTADQYEGTSMQVRRIKESTLANPFSTGAMIKSARYYDANQLAFGQMDEYKSELGALYDEESRYVKRTGSVDEARKTPQFEEALDKFVEATGITRDHAKQYLDYMQSEHNVEQARIAMQAESDKISAQTEMQVQAIAFGGNPADVLGLNGIEAQQNAMVKAQADLIQIELSGQLWWKAVWATITSPLKALTAPIFIISDLLGAIFSFIMGNWDNAAALGGKAVSRLNVTGEAAAYWNAWGQVENTDFNAIGQSNIDETSRANYGNGPTHTNIGRNHGTNLINPPKQQKGGLLAGLFGGGKKGKGGSAFKDHKTVVRDNDRNSFFGGLFGQVISILTGIATTVTTIAIAIVGFEALKGLLGRLGSGEGFNINVDSIKDLFGGLGEGKIGDLLGKISSFKDLIPSFSGIKDSIKEKGIGNTIKDMFGNFDLDLIKAEADEYRGGSLDASHTSLAARIYAKGQDIYDNSETLQGIHQTGKELYNNNETVRNYVDYGKDKLGFVKDSIQGVKEYGSNVGSKWSSYLQDKSASALKNMGYMSQYEDIDKFKESKETFLNDSDREYLIDKYNIDTEGMSAKPAKQSKAIREKLQEQGVWDEALDDLHQNNYTKTGVISKQIHKYTDPWKDYAKQQITDKHDQLKQDAEVYRTSPDSVVYNGQEVYNKENAPLSVKAYATALDMRDKITSKMGLGEGESIIDAIKNPQKMEELARNKIKDKLSSYDENSVIGRYRDKVKRGQELLEDPEKLEAWSKEKLSDFRSRGQDELDMYDYGGYFGSDNMSLAGKAALFKRDKLGIGEDESWEDILTNPERAIEVGRNGYEAIKEHGVGNTINDIVGSSEEGTGIFGELKNTFGIDVDGDMKELLGAEEGESVGDAAVRRGKDLLGNFVGEDFSVEDTLKDKFSTLFDKNTIGEAIEGINIGDAKDSIVTKGKEFLSGLFGQDSIDKISDFFKGDSPISSIKDKILGFFKGEGENKDSDPMEMWRTKAKEIMGDSEGPEGLKDKLSEFMGDSEESKSFKNKISGLFGEESPIKDIGGKVSGFFKGGKGSKIIDPEAYKNVGSSIFTMGDMYKESSPGGFESPASFMSIDEEGEESNPIMDEVQDRIWDKGKQFFKDGKGSKLLDKAKGFLKGGKGGKIGKIGDAAKGLLKGGKGGNILGKVGNIAKGLGGKGGSVGNIIKSIGSIGGEGGSGILSSLSSIGGSSSGILSSLGSAGSSIVGSLGGVGSSIMGGLGSAAGAGSGILASLGGAAGTVGAAGSGILASLGGAAAAGGSALAGIAGTAGGALAGLAGGGGMLAAEGALAATGVGLPIAAALAAGTLLLPHLGDIAGAVGGFITDPIGSIGGALGGAADFIGGGLGAIGGAASGLLGGLFGGDKDKKGGKLGGLGLMGGLGIMGGLFGNNREENKMQDMMGGSDSGLLSGGLMGLLSGEDSPMGGIMGGLGMAAMLGAGPLGLIGGGLLGGVMGGLFGKKKKGKQEDIPTQLDMIISLLGQMTNGEGNQQIMNPLMAAMPGLSMIGGGLMSILGQLMTNKDKKQKDATKAQLNVPNLLEKILNKTKDNNGRQTHTGDLVGKILKALLKDKDNNKNTPTSKGGDVNITIHNININTDDDPEKIKTAFMQLMVELKDQVSPRIVSRTVGEKPEVASDTQTTTPNDQNAQQTADQLQGTNQASQQNNNTSNK